MTDSVQPYELTATEALRRIADGTLTARDWTSSCLERIHAREPDVQAWVHLNEDAAADAEAAQKQGRPFPIPVGAKDIIDICGMPTMMGADFHDPSPAIREGGSIALMREAGCVFMGKTVSTELGHRHPGPTRNPHNADYTPGGSSSGSAAAVADKMVPICLGTQTSGSVIRPAAYCGVIGYKPTYNDFDKTGILANAPSMDTLGIMARSIDDVALLRGILVEDTGSTLPEVTLPDLNFALCTDGPWDQAEEESRRLIEGLMSGLAAKGARIVEIDLAEELPRLMELHRLISGYEFKRTIGFERYRHFDRLSAVLREGRLADGQTVTPQEYQALIIEVAGLKHRLAEKFADLDLVVYPSAAGAALKGLETTGAATFNSAWTLAGHPAITLPLFTASGSGLPIGCQFIGGFAKDDRLLAASKAIMRQFALA